MDHYQQSEAIDILKTLIDIKQERLERLQPLVGGAVSKFDFEQARIDLLEARLRLLMFKP